MNKFTYLCHNICVLEFPIIHSEYALLDNLYQLMKKIISKQDD